MGLLDYHVFLSTAAQRGDRFQWFHQWSHAVPMPHPCLRPISLGLGGVCLVSSVEWGVLEGHDPPGLGRGRAWGGRGLLLLSLQWLVSPGEELTGRGAVSGVGGGGGGGGDVWVDGQQGTGHGGEGGGVGVMVAVIGGRGSWGHE